MTVRFRPQTTTMFIVSISGTDFTFFNNMRFTSFSGIKDSTRMIPYVSPFLHREFQIPTHRVYQPVTISVPYNSTEHREIFRSWNCYANEPLIITVEPVQCGTTGTGEEVSLGYLHRMTGCIWNKCESIEVNREENRISMLTLEFSIARAEELGI